MNFATGSNAWNASGQAWDPVPVAPPISEPTEEPEAAPIDEPETLPTEPLEQESLSDEPEDSRGESPKEPTLAPVVIAPRPAQLIEVDPEADVDVEPLEPVVEPEPLTNAQEDAIPSARLTDQPLDDELPENELSEDLVPANELPGDELVEGVVEDLVPPAHE
jgi:hypothetical protein